MAAMSSIDCAAMLIRGMNQKDRAEVFRQIYDLLPNGGQSHGISTCTEKGHKYKYIGKVLYWIFPPKDKMCCITCGKVKLI